MIIGLGLLATLVTGSGCSTVQCRVLHSRPVAQSVYPAVNNDVNMCRYVWSERGSGLFMATLFCAGYGTDLPISCITDTVCLPYDLWSYRKTRQDTKQIDNTKAIGIGPPPRGGGPPTPPSVRIAYSASRLHQSESAENNKAVAPGE
jgi:uncharacterized protein YceK